MTVEIIILFAILIVTIILLVFELLRLDLVAILCMLALGWSGILDPGEALSGFSSNAVIAMIAVMIMGRGIAATGLMNKLAEYILTVVGKSRRRLLVMVSAAVGLISSFMQNVGAAALFLPAILNISKRESIPASELIMPVGFAAILGGTLTMVASGPLIILNDLLRDSDLQPYGLFAVTPAGLILLFIGIAYFSIFYRWILPRGKQKLEGESSQKKLIDVWHLPFNICRYTIPEGSGLEGETPESSGLWYRFNLNILAASDEENINYAPWRKTRFRAGQEIALMGDMEDIRRFAEKNRLVFHEKLDEFEDLGDPESAGFVEVLVPPHSTMVGKSIRELAFRYNYAVEPVLFFSGGRQIRGDFSDRKIRSGDTLIVHGLWENMLRLKNISEFAVITPFEAVRKDYRKAWVASFCFLGAIALAIMGFSISISLFSGAAAMVLTGVLNIEEAYRAIEWKVVFLIAGLIPLGIAMHKTGAAEFLARRVMDMVQGYHLLYLITAVALLSTLFSLFMSNVASTVVLAPLVINMAKIGGVDPRPLVLMVAVCAANSFILPTHQVNAMLMTPGGYQNRDYLKAGGGMTLIFLAAVIPIFYFFYL